MKMITKIALILSLALVVLSSCTNKKDEIRRELNDGIRASYATKYEIAIEHYNNVLDIDPQNTEAYLNLGRVFFNKKKYEKAMEYYNKTIEIDSSYGEAYKSRAQLNTLLGDRDAACQDYLKAEKYGVPNLYNFTKFCK